MHKARRNTEIPAPCRSLNFSNIHISSCNACLRAALEGLVTRALLFQTLRVFQEFAMSASKTKLLLCAAVLTISAHAARAGDIPSLAGKWDGEFTSDVDGYEGVMQAGLKQTADGQLTGIITYEEYLPYMEQKNIFELHVTVGDVNNDGRADLIAAANLENGVTMFMQIDAVYLPAGTADDSPMLVGTYELFLMDGNGNTRKVDWGTFGIIAILIS